MRRLPSFHALRAFEAAARLGSFVRASEEMHITASAISHQVRALEEHFGRHLFEAGSRAKVLTDDGARLSAGLAHAFDAMETACAEVAPKASASTLTVHCAPSFAAKWLGPRLSSFMERHPSILIRMSTGAGSYDLIRNEATDAAIVYGDVPVGPGMSADPLGEESVIAVCSPSLAASLAGCNQRAMMALPLIESSVSPIRWPRCAWWNDTPSSATGAPKRTPPRTSSRLSSCRASPCSSDPARRSPLPPDLRRKSMPGLHPRLAALQGKRLLDGGSVQRSSPLPPSPSWPGLFRPSTPCSRDGTAAAAASPRLAPWRPSWPAQRRAAPRGWP